MTASDVLQTSDPGSGCRPDKRLVGRSFGAAAERYDGLADLQRSAGERLLSRLPGLGLSPDRVVDVGSGTGYLTACLMDLYPKADLVALDIAEGMLRFARSRHRELGAGRLVCGDAEALPFRDRSVDVVFSNAAIQWCSGFDPVFREFRRVLKPGGIALFSTFGAGTLQELRAAWASVDDYSHVNLFGDSAAMISSLREAGFEELDVSAEINRLEYGSVYDLMRELKGLGAHNVTLDRPRHLTAKGALRRMIAAYERQSAGKGIAATFEIIYGYAGGPAECL